MISSPIADFQPFADAGVFGLAELHAAAAVHRARPDTPTEVLLAYAFAVRAPLHGHVCVDLATVADTTPVDDDDIALTWPPPDQWLALVNGSPLVRLQRSEPHNLRREPLAIDGTRVYLDRYATYEALVADQLVARADQSVDDPADRTSSRAQLLDQFFAADPLDKQRQAADVALTSRLAVIAGGPGTGKTRTVARLIAAILTRNDGANPPLSVALAAPTGKAAARMTEAVRHELGHLTLSPAVATQLDSLEASTIHRLLGPTGGNRFVHDRRNPLPHDLVIVDETSMVSLPLMARLLDALRADASVVLVGDPFQLASVEAGAVLGDLIDASELPASALRDNTITLDRVHRFGADSGIALLATAIRTGDADAALSILGDAAYPDVALTDPLNGNAVSAVLDEAAEAARQVIEAASRGKVSEALTAATNLKVLAATRRGPHGVHWWTDEITQRSGSSIAAADRYNQWYIGRPVMITQNDPVQRVFNGDVGVVAESNGVRSVAIEQQAGAAGQSEIRWIPSVRLGAVDTWWAMTIHKSQGSEFPNVVLSLPMVDSPVVSRELLYTGVTRAKSSVRIVATVHALRRGIERRVVRASGLSELLDHDR